MMTFSYQIKKKPSHSIIALGGNLLDKQAALQLLDEVDNLVAEEQQRFVIDLSELKHINSNGLHVLISVLTKARNAGGDVIISSVPEKIKPLLIMTKLNTVFTVVENNKSAEKSLKTIN